MTPQGNDDEGSGVHVEPLKDMVRLNEMKMLWLLFVEGLDYYVVVASIPLPIYHLALQNRILL